MFYARQHISFMANSAAADAVAVFSFEVCTAFRAV